MNVDEILKALREQPIEAEDASRLVSAVVAANKRSWDRIATGWLVAVVEQGLS